MNPLKKQESRVGILEICAAIHLRKAQRGIKENNKIRKCKNQKIKKGKEV